MTATFKYPGGEFPISNSISLFTDAKRTKPDVEFAKKIETNTISKALSKLGFNTDVYMGKFEDNAYVQARYTEEALATISEEQYDELIDLLVDAEADEKKFFEWFGISNLKELKKSDFMKAKQALLKKIGTKNPKPKELSLWGRLLLCSKNVAMKMPAMKAPKATSKWR